MGRYRSAERETLQAGIAAARAARRSAAEAVENANTAAADAVASADAHAVRGVALGRQKLKRAANKYPEAVVCGTTLLFCNAVGAMNGTMLGRAPRRAAIVAAVTTFVLRAPMAEKWGGTVAAYNARLSGAVREQFEAAGLVKPGE